MNEANICQVAIVSKDAKLLRKWYCDIFGFLPASQTIFAGPLATRVQGVPKDLNFCYWAIDGRKQFQLEFFNFISPDVTPKLANWKPYDHGYNVIGIHSWDFEHVISRLKEENTELLSEIKGDIGERWVMIADPDGNHIELNESDILSEQTKQLPEIPATIRYVRMSVPDIKQAKQLWQSAFGLSVQENSKLVNYHDEILFPDQSASYQQVLLKGTGILLELRQYSVPNPQARLASHNVAEQGIMNIAIGANSVNQWDEYYNNALAQQCTANGKPLDAAIFKVMYVNEPNKENIEILYPRPWAYSLTGFNPGGVFARGEILINAPVEHVWNVITDHNNAGKWAFFSSELTQQGEDYANGLNAVRKIGLFGLTFFEKVSGWRPEKAYLYHLQSKWLIRNHKGMVHLSQLGESVKVCWSIHFSSPLPGLGKLNSVILSRMIKQSLKKLKIEVEV